jgi:hypothetical protein
MAVEAEGEDCVDASAVDGGRWPGWVLGVCLPGVEESVVLSAESEVQQGPC